MKKQNFLKGAAILAAASIFVKIIGAVYKIPIFNILDDEGIGYFQVTYNIYTLILTISTAGVPVALSRLISSAAARGDNGLVKRYFKVSLPAFMIIGAVAMAVMLIFANTFARLMNSSPAAAGVRTLAPAVFFVCIISVYRGYAQGFENMIPTAMSQVVEVVCKAAFGIAAAMWLMSMGRESHIVSAGAIMGVTIGLGLCIPLLIWYKKKLDRGLSFPDDTAGLPSRLGVFGRLLKVSIPITLSSSFLSIMIVIDTSIILGRLQTALHYTEGEANALFSIFTRGLTIYNLPPAVVIPLAVSIVPAIAAALTKNREDEAKDIMRSSIKLCNLLTMPACAGIMALSGPILVALYGDSRQITSTVLIILGAASFFVCLQHITLAILQANGHEKLAMLTFPIGAVFRIVFSFVLVGNPNIGILGSPFGTLACFMVMSAMNIIFILTKVKARDKIAGTFAKPLLCTAIMAVTAFFVYKLLYMVGSGMIGTGRMAVCIYLGAAIVVGVVVYVVLIIATRTLTTKDMKLVPKGDKLAKLLRIK